MRALGADAKAGIGTLRALLDLYGDQVGVELKAWPEARRRLDHVFNYHLGRSLGVLTAADLQMTVDAHRAKQSAAAAVRCIRRVLKWASREGRRFVTPETAFIYPPVMPGHRERVLTADELRALLPVLAASPRPYANALRFMLLTLARREEVGAATWRDMDLDGAVWTIPTTKNTRGHRLNSRPHRVPLCRQALGLLRARGPGEHDALVFATETGGRLLNWDRETKALQVASSTAAWNRHDLRRTGATMLGEMGFEPHIIEAALNHTAIHSQLAATYNRARYFPEVARALQALADSLDVIQAGGANTVGPYCSTGWERALEGTEVSGK